MEGFRRNLSQADANSLFLFFLPLVQEAKRVLKEDKEIGNCKLLMDVWVPKAGCSGFGLVTNGSWIRMFGLVAHLWSNQTLKLIRDEYGGFIKAELADSSSIEWVRIFVSSPTTALSEITINDGYVSFVGVERGTPSHLESKRKKESFQEQGLSDLPSSLFNLQVRRIVGGEVSQQE